MLYLRRIEKSVSEKDSIYQISKDQPSHQTMMVFLVTYMIPHII